MTTVHIDLRGANDEPAVGSILFAPTRRRDVADYIILPQPFVEELVAGVLDVELDPTESTWAWSIIERTKKGIRRYVSVPDSVTPVLYSDLVDVDPDTLTPMDPVPPSAQDILAEAEEARDEAVAAADTVGLMVPRPVEFAADLLSVPDTLNNEWRYQQASYSQDNIITLDDGTMYAVWIRTDLHQIIGKLSPGSATWQTFDLRTIPGDPFGAEVADGHNTFSLGVDSAGRIHVSGNMHNVALRYARSTNPADITSWTVGTMIGTEENSVSYPAFVSDSNGVLYFAYRNGGSSSGDNYLNRWTGAAWTRVAQLHDGTTGSVNAYLNRIAPDANGGLHFMWVWRESTSVESTSDIGYVKYTGSAFVKSTGAAQTMPITQANEERVLTIAQSSGLVNQSGLDVDADGIPHGVFMWYDADGKTQYFHVWKSGTWLSDQVSSFTDRVETIGAISTLNLVVARPQIVTTSTGRVFVIGRAESTERNRPILIEASNPAHPVSVLFDMDVTTWEPAFDLRTLRRSDALRMLVTDLDSPATVGAGYNKQWGGILTIDLSSTPLIDGGAPRFGAADAGRAMDAATRGALTLNTDLNTLSRFEDVGAHLMPTGVALVNQPLQGVTRPATLVVTKPHGAVTFQTIVEAAGRVFTRTCNSDVWSPWIAVTGGSLASLADGTALSTLWHGDYLLSSGASNDYPGEPADFATLNAAGVLEVRLVATTGSSTTKFYRLTSFDRTAAWEATMSSGVLSAWLKVR